MDMRDEQRAWLQRVIAETGIAPTTLAQQAGLSPTTLTRFLNNPEHATALSMRTISAVEKQTGIPYGPTPTPIRAKLLAREDAEAFDLEDGSRLATKVRAVLNGSHMFPWTLRSRALETIGFIPGDILIVDLNEPARPGDAVCAQVYDFKSMRAETLFRLFEPPFLYAATMDRLQSAPILIDGNVGIKGPVVLSVRPRLARPEAA